MALRKGNLTAFEPLSSYMICFSQKAFLTLYADVNFLIKCHLGKH